MISYTNSNHQHNVSQAPQQIQAGHPGPTPHAMQHLHPNQHFQQQQMQAMANVNNPQLLQQRLFRHPQQMFMNGLSVSSAGNPGVPGNPQNSGIAGFVGTNPHRMQSQMLHQQQLQAQIHQHQQQQQQQQHLVAAQQLANQVQAAGQNMSMSQQQGTIPANAGATSGSGQQLSLAATHATLLARQQAQQPQQNKPTGQAILRMLNFNFRLSLFEKDKQVNTILHWRRFVLEFFSPNGLMRLALWHNQTREGKQFEIGNAILPRFFWELIESGVHSVQFQLEGLKEKDLPGGQGMVVECHRAGLLYRYKDAVCFHHGSLKATLNAALQIDMLEFTVTEHQEFVSRSSLQSTPISNDSPDVKASPHNKQLGKRPLPQGQQASQGVPEGITNSYGLHPMVVRFLEVCINYKLTCYSDCTKMTILDCRDNGILAGYHELLSRVPGPHTEGCTPQSSRAAPTHAASDCAAATTPTTPTPDATSRCYCSCKCAKDANLSTASRRTKCGSWRATNAE
ncbi:hypothetical protein L211DRAFT_479405 [Terfezia boudieri ATCC MYA-4762]|uniref:LIM-domain-containing protein n=1 Tax=Terfezia boudieri ATCC MYA-4762 TaxID=1051890 RepID=A0A3N4LYP0_9PEZI|nr:hypothetical protein L211DRAFT_479405 [Terfezia boudieri ATCC MYA-4762]